MRCVCAGHNCKLPNRELCKETREQSTRYCIYSRRAASHPIATRYRNVYPVAHRRPTMAKFHHRFFDNGMNIAAALAVLLAASLSGCVTGTDPAQNAVLSRIPGAGVTVYAAGDIADCRNFKPADSG